MTIKLACYSIVSKKSTIEEKYRGGLASFTKSYSVWGLTQDEHLVKISFMSIDDIYSVVDEIVGCGLGYDRAKNQSNDFVIADKYTGPFWNVDWLEFGHKECWYK